MTPPSSRTLFHITPSHLGSHVPSKCRCSDTKSSEYNATTNWKGCLWLNKSSREELTVLNQFDRARTQHGGDLHAVTLRSRVGCPPIDSWALPDEVSRAVKAAGGDSVFWRGIGRHGGLHSHGVVRIDPVNGGNYLKSLCKALGSKGGRVKAVYCLPRWVAYCANHRMGIGVRGRYLKSTITYPPPLPAVSVGQQIVSRAKQPIRRRLSRRVCGCGCKRSFRPGRTDQRYLDRNHKKRACRRRGIAERANGETE